MIAGVGIDLVDLVGFREQLDDTASVFVERTFTAHERAVAGARPGSDPARHLGARFAAKEAFVKAWSSSMRGRAPVLRSVDLREIEVVSDEWGRPALRLHGALAAAVGACHLCVSLSHDGDLATAVVTFEKG